MSAYTHSAESFFFKWEKLKTLSFCASNQSQLNVDFLKITETLLFKNIVSLENQFIQN